MHIKVTPTDININDKIKQAEYLRSVKMDIEEIAKGFEGMIRWKNITYFSSDFYYFFSSKIHAQKFLDRLLMYSPVGQFTVEIKETGRQPSYMYPCIPGKTPGIDEDILAMISEIEES